MITSLLILYLCFINMKQYSCRPYNFLNIKEQFCIVTCVLNVSTSIQKAGLFRGEE